MVVDFRFEKAPAFAAVTIDWTGPWNERRIRREFETLARWAAERKITAGRWYFMEPGTRRWRVAIAVRGKVRGSGRIKARRYPATTVVRVRFDPDEVSPRIVYHGLTDYLRWRRKDKEIRSVGAFREVYEANPWTHPRAWANLAVEAVVRR